MKTAYVITLETYRTLKNDDCEKELKFLAVCHSSEDCKKVMLKEKERIMNSYKHKKNFGLNQTFEGNDASRYFCYVDLTDSKGDYIEYCMDVDKVKEI